MANKTHPNTAAEELLKSLRQLYPQTRSIIKRIELATCDGVLLPYEACDLYQYYKEQK